MGIAPNFIENESVVAENHHFPDRQRFGSGHCSSTRVQDGVVLDRQRLIVSGRVGVKRLNMDGDGLGMKALLYG